MRAVATNSVAAYLARLAAGSKHGWLCVLLLFIIYFILFFTIAARPVISKSTGTNLREIFSFGRNMAVE